MVAIREANDSHPSPVLTPVPQCSLGGKEVRFGGEGLNCRGHSTVLSTLARFYTKEDACHETRQAAGVAGLRGSLSSCGGRSTAECMFMFTYMIAVLQRRADEARAEGDGPLEIRDVAGHADFLIAVSPESQTSLRYASAPSWGSCLGPSSASRLPTPLKPSPPGWQPRLTSQRLCWLPRSAVLCGSGCTY